MTPSDQIQLASVVVAIVLGVASLAISLRANRLSASAERLAREAYSAERRIALTSARSASEGGVEYLALAPAGSEQTVNNVTLVFPSRVRQRPLTVAAGDLRLNVSALEHDLRTYWDGRTPAKQGHAVVRERAPVPVGVLVHGMSKGDAVVSHGIYDLYCQYIRYPDKPSHVKVIGLSLNNWLAPGSDVQTEVDQILSQHESLGAGL
jgi:type II secretory pathway pseudopilin PulG